MGFVVDKVSEDSFYENLLLGLSKVLERNPCVSKLILRRISGVRLVVPSSLQKSPNLFLSIHRQADIRAWEHNNGVILPEDLRSFFSSTNGFLFTYEFSYDYRSPSDEEKDFRLGSIQINALTDLTRIFGYETKNSAQVQSTGKTWTLTLSRESKVFELANVDENVNVVLVYPTSYSAPTIWFYCSGQKQFTFLADDFTTYFRIPSWQYAYSKEGVPEWSREMFNVIAPGILVDDRNLLDAHSYKYCIENVNKVDSNIFTMAQSGSNVAVPAERVQSNVRQPDVRSMRERQKVKTVPRRAVSCKNKKSV
ncbi:tubulin polyglutamylase complex subunit 2 isoform X2 [Euwallacea fornicatus]|uniref:tubulin polyglutamylase complex subunit 2 isoform X2 n=1 Tax=Euwallacea fornicatus TaxID=995702 RepID=UPI00338E8600